MGKERKPEQKGQPKAGDKPRRHGASNGRTMGMPGPAGKGGWRGESIPEKQGGALIVKHVAQGTMYGGSPSGVSAT